MANPDWGIKQGDTTPAIAAILKDADGTVINLSGCTVKFHMRSKHGAVTVNAAATIVDAATGSVSYTWGATDTDTAGDYEIEWEITDASSKVATVPTGQPDTLTVYSQLA